MLVLLALMAVNAVLQFIDPAAIATNVDLTDILITQKVGGTFDDTD